MIYNKDFVRKVKGHVQHYKKCLNLEEWDVSVKFIKKKSNLSGSIEANAKYLRAVMEIHPKNIVNNYTLKLVIRHELLHLLHAEYDAMLETVMKPIEEHFGESVSNMSYNCTRHATERLVTRIERILDRGKYTSLSLKP